MIARNTTSAGGQRGAPPARQCGDSGHADRRGGPAEIAGESVRRERRREPAGGDAAVEDGEVRRVEDGVSSPGEDRREEQRGISLGRGEDDRREGEEAQAGPEHPVRSVTIDRESRQGLAHAGDDEEGGGERPRGGEGETEIGHQPGEQRGDDEVEEVRRGVSEADHRHDPRVAAAAGGRTPRFDWTAHGCGPDTFRLLRRYIAIVMANCSARRLARPQGWRCGIGARGNLRAGHWQISRPWTAQNVRGQGSASAAPARRNRP
jgi:hypothetical protein